MSVFNFMNQEKKKIKASSVVGITESGKREAQRFSSRGPHFEILAVLDDKSPQTVSQIADEASMPESEVIQRLKVMANQQYVKFTGVEG